MNTLDADIPQIEIYVNFTELSASELITLIESTNRVYAALLEPESFEPALWTFLSQYRASGGSGMNGAASLDVAQIATGNSIVFKFGPNKKELRINWDLIDYETELTKRKAAVIATAALLAATPPTITYLQDRIHKYEETRNLIADTKDKEASTRLKEFEAMKLQYEADKMCVRVLDAPMASRGSLQHRQWSEVQRANFDMHNLLIRPNIVDIKVNGKSIKTDH